MRPTGYLAGSAYCPTRSAARTRAAPVRAEATIFPLPPLPESLVAIGPERKATDAIGPDTAVANAVSSREKRIKSRRVKLGLAPKVCENSFPSCIASRCLLSTRIAIPAPTTMHARRGMFSILAELRLPLSHLRAPLS